MTQFSPYPSPLITSSGWIYRKATDGKQSPAKGLAPAIKFSSSWILTA